MSGKRQHYIPRFLLNGFASRTEGEEGYVWCFRKDKKPFESNIVNIGLAKGFYGEPGEEAKDSLDNLMTTEEGEYAECVQKARRDEELNPSDIETLIEFVLDLTTRTKNLRDTLTSAFRAMLGEFQPVVTDGEAARQWLINEQKNNSDFWQQIRDDYIRKKHGNVNRQRFRYLRKKEDREFARWFQQGADPHFQMMAQRYKAQFDSLSGQLSEVAQTSHNSALKKEKLSRGLDDRTPCRQHHQKLFWSIRRSATERLILGDVGVLQYSRDSGEFSPGYDGIKGDTFLLPLSSDCLLVGSADESVVLPSVDAINQNAAALSFDFFVSSQNSERELEYQNLIRSGTYRPPKILEPASEST